MEENTTPPAQQETPWVGYLILAVIVIFTFKMCSSCMESNEDVPVEETPVTRLQTDIGYRFVDQNASYGNPPHNEYYYRSFAYKITNFDKDNSECWMDLYRFGDSVAMSSDKDKKLMTTMVYFFVDSDSLKLQDENDWNITWDESQDSLWIGNYFWIAKNGHTEVVKGTYYK